MNIGYELLTSVGLDEQIHLLCDMNGNVVAVDLSAGSAHDWAPVKGVFLDNIMA